MFAFRAFLLGWVVSAWAALGFYWAALTVFAVSAALVLYWVVVQG
jgi:hypothetical protein